MGAETRQMSTRKPACNLKLVIEETPPRLTGAVMTANFLLACEDEVVPISGKSAQIRATSMHPTSRALGWRSAGMDDEKPCFRLYRSFLCWTHAVQPGGELGLSSCEFVQPSDRVPASLLTASDGMAQRRWTGKCHFDRHTDGHRFVFHDDDDNASTRSYATPGNSSGGKAGMSLDGGNTMRDRWKISLDTSPWS
ncbi:unnamed protein product [Soboliphyme baturini]|uniref:Ricin B-type lectin domain-containing protein n=1 Tax=Soboliphyme baturini TaxID=241478 RepID=A0A183IZJ7_9BILA|nr:unnamed protein product [Soboliphyme baturini]